MKLPEGNVLKTKTPVKSSPKIVGDSEKGAGGGRNKTDFVRTIVRTPVSASKPSAVKQANQEKFYESLKTNGILEKVSPGPEKARTPVSTQKKKPELSPASSYSLSPVHPSYIPNLNVVSTSGGKNIS